jgi:hypothetical protein
MISVLTSWVPPPIGLQDLFALQEPVWPFARD